MFCLFCIFSFACILVLGNPVFFRNRREGRPLRTGLRRSLCLSPREFRVPEGLGVLSPLSLAEGPHAEVHHTGGPPRGWVPMGQSISRTFCLTATLKEMKWEGGS